MRRYSDREGHTFIPKSYLTQDGYLLGKWVAEQRGTQSQSKLSSKQRRLLEKLPGWVWDVSQAKWAVEDTSLARGFTKLREWVDRGGNPYSYYDDDWARRCRLQYRAGRLSPKAVWLLENTQGWTWDLVPAIRRKRRQEPHDQWIQGLECLSEYVNRFGHMYVDEDYIAGNGFPLGEWYRRQATAYAEGRLSKRRRKALEELADRTRY